MTDKLNSHPTVEGRGCFVFSSYKSVDADKRFCLLLKLLLLNCHVERTAIFVVSETFTHVRVLRREGYVKYTILPNKS